MNLVVIIALILQFKDCLQFLYKTYCDKTTYNGKQKKD